jgi:hypothetical protein
MRLKSQRVEVEEEDLLSSALDNLPLPSSASSPQHRPCPRAPHSIWPSSGAWLRALPRSSSPRATSSIRRAHTSARRYHAGFYARRRRSSRWKRSQKTTSGAYTSRCQRRNAHKTALRTREVPLTISHILMSSTHKPIAIRF